MHRIRDCACVTQCCTLPDTECFRPLPINGSILPIITDKLSLLRCKHGGISLLLLCGYACKAGELHHRIHAKCRMTFLSQELPASVSGSSAMVSSPIISVEVVDTVQLFGCLRSVCLQPALSEPSASKRYAATPPSAFMNFLEAMKCLPCPMKPGV